MMKESKSIFMIMLITILSKGLGFFREVALASTFGTTAYTDAYLIARTITLGLFSGLGGALSTTFIPLYTNIVEKENRVQAIKFTNSVLNIVIIFTIILSIVGILFTKPLVNIFAVGFEGETLKLSIKFTRLLLPGMVFIGINFILTGYLEANKRFNISAFIAFPNNMIIITAIFLSSIWDKNILIYGTLLGMVSQILFQSYFACKTGYTYTLRPPLKNGHIKKLLYLVMPVFLGMAVQQINVLIDRTLASTLPEGSIAALNFADRLNLFVYGVFTASVATVIYPRLSQLAAKNDRRAFKNDIIKSINFMCLLIIPISIGSMCLCKPIVKVLFQRGVFDTRATQMTSIALFYYSIGMIGFGLRHILSKIFYSLQDTKTPMINGAIAVVINIILNFILIRYMMHGGLALATSISSLLGTTLLLYRLRLKLGPFGGRKILNVIVKVSISSIFMGVCVKLFYHYISMARGTGFLNEAFSLSSSILLGGFIYFICILFMKVEEVNELLDMVRSKMSFSTPAKYLDLTEEKQKLLLGIVTSESREIQKNVYDIISLLPENKYDITLIITPHSGMPQWITQLNKRRIIKVKLITMTSPKYKMNVVEAWKTFLELYSMMKKGGYDMVHFHSYKIGIAGCWAAWFARVPKIFFTVYAWNISTYQQHWKKKMIGMLERLAGKLVTKTICISNYDMQKGVESKWIHREKVCVIYQSFSNYPSSKKGKLQKELNIKKGVPIIGMIAPMDPSHNPLFLIKVFYELKKRGHKSKLVIIGDGPLKEPCAGVIYDLGLNLEVFLLKERKDARELLNDFEVFAYFSNDRIYPLNIIEAMSAQKPILANNTGGMSEFISNERNGYLLKELDVNQGVKCIENLLNHHSLRKEMGKIGRKMAYCKFNKENKVKEYERIYGSLDTHLLKSQDKSCK